MFLKKVTIKKEGKTYNYYKIVASYRNKTEKPSTVSFKTLVLYLTKMPQG